MKTITNYITPTSAPAAASSDAICETDVQKAQAAWASAIKKISKTYLDGGGSYIGIMEKKMETI